MIGPKSVAAVVIGRNEGERLVSCLTSLGGRVKRIVYVDSGSTDGSSDKAMSLGAEVVDLDLSTPFTAARARNAGAALALEDPQIAYLQFVDGDCEVQESWIETAAGFLEQQPDAAVACGRRRERFPDRSVYNRLCDWEWDTPIGEARACGGDAMMRRSAFEQVGGYDPKMIAGEEPELCVRLRAKGWTIWRLDAEMTLHDADITRLSQWWKRARRAGHSFAEGAHRHGAPPERHNVRELRSCLAWGAGIPMATLLMAMVSPWALLALAAYPGQVIRLTRRFGGDRDARTRAVFLTLGKFPEALGAAEYFLRKAIRRPRALIEYK